MLVTVSYRHRGDDRVATLEANSISISDEGELVAGDRSWPLSEWRAFQVVNSR